MPGSLSPSSHHGTQKKLTISERNNAPARLCAAAPFEKLSVNQLPFGTSRKWISVLASVP